MNNDQAIKGIDSLRFFAASWVVLYHGGQFPIEHLAKNPHQASLFHELGRLPFNGISAVILFFVISGFCIHFGSIARTTFDWRRFLIQRVVRIGVPLAAILALSASLGSSYSAAVGAVLWSVYSEIIYYLIYPILRHLMIGKRIIWLLLGSTLISLVMAILNPRLIFPGEFGAYTWLFCLPMWIVGCYLAQIYRSQKFNLPRAPLSLFRLGAIAFGSAAAVISHLPGHAIGYIWTMPPFSIYCALWLWLEIKQFKLTAVMRTFESLGAASYSIYLTHKIIINYANQFTGHANWLMVWSCQLAGFITLATIFYLVVERPSHNLSRMLGSSWAKWSATRLQVAD